MGYPPALAQPPHIYKTYMKLEANKEFMENLCLQLWAFCTRNSTCLIPELITGPFNPGSLQVFWPLVVFYPLSSSCIYLTVLISHFWIVCLLFFYGVLRKNHLLPSSRHIFAPSQQLIRLVRSDFQFFPGVPLLSLTIPWGNKQVV